MSWTMNLNPEIFRAIAQYYSNERGVSFECGTRMLKKNVKRFLESGVVNKIDEPPFVELSR